MEIFAGTGRLTAAIRQLGFRSSFGIDHQISAKLVAPILQLDLTVPANFNFVQDILKEPLCLYAHFAPPCGTASRARTIQRRGQYNPPPLRSDAFPNGLPNLGPINQQRVQAANQLYDLTQQLCRLCIQHGVLFTIENPARSFMWQTTHMQQFLDTFQLHSTFFHHCMYGSSRRKHTRLVHNIPTVTQMELTCDNTHAH